MNVISISLLSISILLVVVYVFHNRIIRIVAMFTHIVFFTGLLGLLSILFLSDQYDTQVDGQLSKHYIGIKLVEADSSINAMNESSSKIQSLWDSIVGNENEPEIKEESELYASVLSFISFSLQFLIGLVSLFLMLIGIYFKYSFLGYMNVDRNKRRITRLEKNMEIKT